MLQSVIKHQSAIFSSIFMLTEILLSLAKYHHAYKGVYDRNINVTYYTPLQACIYVVYAYISRYIINTCWYDDRSLLSNIDFYLLVNYISLQGPALLRSSSLLRIVIYIPGNHIYHRYTGIPWVIFKPLVPGTIVRSK